MIPNELSYANGRTASNKMYVPLWGSVEVFSSIFHATFGAMGQFTNLKPTTSHT